ncbi:MAG: TerC family protein [Legionella sp.]|nr:TerC family protein [Legionella sp.]
MELIDLIASVLVLVILEVILGIDNLIILSILTERLPLAQRRKARRWGLTLSWIARILLLALAVDMIKLVKPLFTWGDMSFSPRDIFLIAGGAFLIWKATDEIHQEVTEEENYPALEPKKNNQVTFKKVMLQVVIMDIIFSLDSVLTAVGLTTRFWVMAFAITCAIIIMIYASEGVSNFIKKNPTIKMLALSYLILIGVLLIADGFQFHIPRGYLYSAMGFSLAVESLNQLKRTRKGRGK